MKSLCAFLLVLSLGLSASPATAQSRAADSLRNLLRTHPQADTLHVRRLFALIIELAANDAPQACLLSRQALAMAQKISDSTGIVRSYVWLSILHRRQSNYDSARYYIRFAQQLAVHRHDRRREAQSYLELSLIDQMQGNLASAQKWALRGLKLAENIQNLPLQTQLSTTLGGVYSELGDYKNATRTLRIALHNGQKMGDLQVVSATLNSLAKAYQEQKNWPQALRYFRQAAQVSRRMGDVQNETVNEIGQAEVYSQQGDQTQALQHGSYARTLVRQNHDAFNLPSVELLLANSFLLTQRPDSAIALAQHALQLSQKTRTNGNISKASDILAQAYAAVGKFQDAYRYERLFVAYQDTLAGAETQRKTSDMRNSYELDKQRTQIALLDKTRQLQAQTAARQRAQLLWLLTGLGGLVALAGLLWRNIYIKQRANRHLNEKNEQIAQQRDDLTRTLAELKTTQAQLIQREKMASLGELTAGIAHEIQNPLNFVNNFSEVSVELVDEFMDGPWQQLPEAEKLYATELLDALTQNLQKITHHGRRADNIVKGMLQHSHGAPGQSEPTDFNALVAEHLSLAYQSFRAKNKTFTATLNCDFNAQVAQVTVVPQDIGRVLLNLYTNAFYALRQRQQRGEAGYTPELSVSTKRLANQIQISVRDNGSGMSPEVQQKVFQPFFTTKPPGEGTGLGLSLSYDIITKGHNGTLTVSSEEGKGTEILICLPA
ncbi:ATP-binding protein [Hymenobacter jejuensis]|uniref:histidine kinase n=1 Tax=Hymenobacter jejuensis TaxID=2502781 RepID=A0A5B7ZZS3_9BACT|nr:ATP-binding protein [Hymenobacter jejuensis]QDA60520.1 tetratricopeptide repeat protein [Hymenobacter jejuensis]